MTKFNIVLHGLSFLLIIIILYDARKPPIPEELVDGTEPTRISSELNEAISKISHSVNQNALQIAELKESVQEIYNFQDQIGKAMLSPNGEREPTSEIIYSPDANARIEENNHDFSSLSNLSRKYEQEYRTPSNRELVDSVDKAIQSASAHNNIQINRNCGGSVCKIVLYGGWSELKEITQNFAFAFPGEKMIRENSSEKSVEIYARFSEKTN